MDVNPVNYRDSAMPCDALLRQTFDCLPALVWICGADGRTTLFNKRWLEFTGCVLPRVLDELWEVSVHPGDLERRRAAQAAALDTHQAFAAEYRLRRADGEYRSMLEQALPQFGAQGEFLGYVGGAVDITERKRAEEQLRWLSKAMEQSPAIVVITDLQGNIEYVNPKFTEVTGYTSEEVLGRNPRILKSGETTAEEYRKMWATIQTGEWRGEFHNKRKNGELYWEAASICPIRDDTGQPAHYIAVKENITDRKLMEAALRASEERFHIAVENAQLTVYDLEPKIGSVKVYGPDPFLNGVKTAEEWVNAIHPADRDRVWAAHGRRLEGGEGLNQEYRIIDQDGNIRHYLDHGAPDRDGRVMGVLRNVTEERRAEQSLAQLAAIVECSNDAILSFDRDCILRSWNTAAEKLYGYSAGEILGQPVSVLVEPDLRKTASENIASIAAGTGIQSLESRHMRKDGTIFPVSLAASAIRDRTGKAVGGSAIIRDITEKKQAEKALQESENRFRVLVQHSTDVITLIDPAGVVLYDSPGISGLLGISPEQRLGCDAFDSLHPDDLSRVRELHEKLLHTTAKLRCQLRLRHADGSWRWCDSWAANLLGEPGVCAIVTSFRDITELKDVETALRESEQRYRRLIENASDAIFTVDLEGNFTTVNTIAEQISGYSRQELLVMNLGRIAAPEYLPAIRHSIGSHLAGGEPPPLEVELVTRDGARVALEISGRLGFRNDLPFDVLCIARDISQRKRTERQEQNRREVLEMVAQNRPLDAVLRRLEEIIEHDYPGVAAYISPSNEALAGTRRPPRQDNTTGDPQSHLTVPIETSGGVVLGNIEIDYPGRWNAADLQQNLLDSKARLAAIALEHRQLTDRLAHQAHHDPLTGLPNRTLLDDRLRQALILARRESRLVAVIYVDLDRFKFINDSLGHDVGDVLLNEVAKRLQGAMRESDTLARPGGDEFVAVLFGIDSERAAEASCERIIEIMQSPFQVMGQELFISASVGLCLFPQDGKDAATLQKHADVAMYEAKNRGRNRFQKFAQEMNSASHERLEVGNQLHRALERGELLLHYQPQFQLPSRDLGGVEALLRWNHPKWGLLPPGRFVPVAEESGLIIPISLWVLREACRQHQQWRHSGLPPVRIAVNISATQFTRTNLAGQVAQVLAGHEMEPRYLELEITERVLMRDIQDSARQIAELRALGVRISIDDFGTGYSSLSYLQRLPIDDLKIDQCFVQGMGQTASTRPLVQAIIGLAHGLHMTATAEGVETESQLAALEALGCDKAQGFLLGRPAPGATWATAWQADGQHPVWDRSSLSELRA